MSYRKLLTILTSKVCNIVVLFLFSVFNNEKTKLKTFFERYRLRLIILTDLVRDFLFILVNVQFTNPLSMIFYRKLEGCSSIKYCTIYQSF